MIDFKDIINLIGLVVILGLLIALTPDIKKALKKLKRRIKGLRR